jgi:hypothetical protein
MKCDAYIETRAHDYRMSEIVKKGKEAVNLYVSLQIKKMMGETMTRIPKGVFKKSSHNPNVRVAQN